MTDEPQHPTQPVTPPAPQFTEAPYSGNVRARIGGYDWQLTIRSAQFENFTRKIDGLMTWLNTKADKAVNLELPPNVPAPVVGVPPAPTVQQQANGPQRVQCVMIEVGTSYTGGKTQLKFACDGMEFPLTYTKPMGDMVKLLTPIGFTATHLIVGKKYPVNCFVTYHENTNDGKTYKNVDKVEAA